MQPAETARFIEKVFRKGSDFSMAALRYVRRTRSLLDRILRRDLQNQESVRQEAARLIQFAILLAVRRPDRHVAYRRTADHLLRHLYGSSIEEVEQHSPDYLEGEPAEVFVRNVWDITGARQDFEIFAMCCLRIRGMLYALVDLFDEVIGGLAEDPNGYFVSFVRAVAPSSPRAGSQPNAEV